MTYRCITIVTVYMTTQTTNIHSIHTNASFVSVAWCRELKPDVEDQQSQQWASLCYTQQIRQSLLLSKMKWIEVVVFLETCVASWRIYFGVKCGESIYSGSVRRYFPTAHWVRAVVVKLTEQSHVTWHGTQVEFQRYCPSPPLSPKPSLFLNES